MCNNDTYINSNLMIYIYYLMDSSENEKKISWSDLIQRYIVDCGIIQLNLCYFWFLLFGVYLYNCSFVVLNIFMF